ncbi:MAG: nuclear transport factor 2 family protein [Polyangiaceae bacterium]
MSTSAANKALVTAALDAVFTRRDESALDRYFTESYLQHNPGLPSGTAPLRGLVSAGGISARAARVLADGDLVAVHSEYTGFGPTPMVAFDIFRVEGGKIAEHWDVMQPVAEKTVSGRSQTDGPTEVEAPERTEESRSLVKGFVDEILFAGRSEKITQFVSTERYDQHNPNVGDGLAGLGKALEEMAKAGLPMKYEKTHRILAEGNFVLTHSEGNFGGKHVAFADLFRVEGGKIVEHWDAIQEVPEKTASGLGMF